MNEIQEMKDTIRRLHGVESTHEESVRVAEEFNGNTVWDGMVEVFQLHSHPQAPKVYVWANNTEDKRNRVVTVLHANYVTSPVHAVRAFIVRK